MKQTAVEWLIDKLKSQGLLIGEPDNLVAVNQAKEMEKEQIMMAHCHNRCLNNKTYECSIKAFENSEQYYNETFNTKEK